MSERPVTDRQRGMLDHLCRRLTWTPDKFAAFLAEHDLTLLTLTTAQASTVITALDAIDKGLPLPVSPILALTVRQPWAWAIFHGKDVENRSWPTRYRGLVAIHAAAGMTRPEYAEAAALIRQYADAPLPAFDDLVRGAVLGTARLIDCVTDSPSPWFFGDYGFCLTDAVLFDQPLPARGALGFWPWTPPQQVQP